MQNDTLLTRVGQLNVLKLGLGLFVAWLLFVIANPIVMVPVGHRGVVTRFGAITGQLRGEGIHFRIPFVEGNKNIEVRIQKEEVSATAASKDLQSVSSVVAVNYAVNPNQVVQLYQNVGEGYRERLISPAIQESVKSVTARFTAEELITKRGEVSDQILTELRNRLTTEGLTVSDLNIVDFDFSASFNRAIEEKVTAEQNALAAKNKLEQVKYEAEQQVAAAKGKAEAQRIEGVALSSNPQVIELRAIEKWDGRLPTYMTGTNTPFVKIN
ncbi:MAG TPA: prohibitin family protein [Vitreimonas sp.]|nr:prohibitin family protein [Vitreimonas sp.]